MPNIVTHKLSIDEVDFRLRTLQNIVNDDFVKA